MQELEATWVGKTVDVVIEQVEPDNNKIIGSIRTAIRYRYARDMAVRPTASHQSDCFVCTAVQPCSVALQVPMAPVLRATHLLHRELCTAARQPGHEALVTVPMPAMPMTEARHTASHAPTGA